ncbi:MAG TPA: MlaD family protein [Acidimicrobiales bacterium]|jgi:phospholipid/cholesterol/gamma-HCH transport system substrate-binding protein|nr:MlaD family protein [Acidimicrobiales bacterium]
MKSFRDRNPIVVGLVSVAIIGALVAFAFAVGILRLFEKAYAAQAVFNDASGIHAGDDVRVAGVKVGRVTKVRADREEGTVIVDFLVNRGIDLGPETTAEIALQTLLGTKFLRLDGEVERPYLAELPEDERVIPLERTKTPFDVFELTKVGTRSIEATDTEKLNRLITQLADISEGKHDQIAELASGITDVSAAITDREAQLSQLLDRARTLSDTLAEKDETLVALIDQSQAVLDLVARRRTDIGRALDDGATSLEQLSRIVQVHKTQLDLILDTLHPTVDILDRRSGDIDRSLSWLGTGALGLAKASTKGPWQDIYIRSLGPDVITLLESFVGTEGVVP